MKYFIVDNQVALFVYSNDGLEYERLIIKIKDVIDAKFVSPSVILPIPVDAPPEIPRAILETVDKRIKIAISKNRVDLNYSYQGINGDKIDSLIIDSIVKLSDVLNEFDFIFTRIGVVSRYFSPCNSPSKIIYNSLTKIKNDNIKEITIRVNRDGTIEHLKINNVFTYEQALRATDNRQGILIIRDLNTVHAERSVLAHSDVKIFIEKAIELLNSENHTKELADE